MLIFLRFIFINYIKIHIQMIQNNQQNINQVSIPKSISRVNFLYNFVKENNIKKPQFICYFIALALIIYFIIVTIFGEKGLFFYKSLKSQVQNKEFVKKELIGKMRTKKSMVEGMNLESLDLDLVDEQSRKVLGYVGKSEVVIYQDKKTDEDESN
jgi:cell division protein FtsB